LVPETDARAILNGERISYWLGVGAQPSDKVAVLIKKYGAGGTHLDEQKAALERLSQKRSRPGVPTDITPAKPAPKKAKPAKAAKVEEAPAPVEEPAAPVEEAPAAE
jgi:small subunit ribosomal protein S16